MDGYLTLPKEDKDEEDSIRLNPTYIKSVKHKKDKLIIILKKVPSSSGYEIICQRKKKGKRKKYVDTVNLRFSIGVVCAMQYTIYNELGEIWIK